MLVFGEAIVDVITFRRHQLFDRRINDFFFGLGMRNQQFCHLLQQLLRIVVVAFELLENALKLLVVFFDQGDSTAIDYSSSSRWLPSTLQPGGAIPASWIRPT